MDLNPYKTNTDLAADEKEPSKTPGPLQNPLFVFPSTGILIAAIFIVPGFFGLPSLEINVDGKPWSPFWAFPIFAFFGFVLGAATLATKAIYQLVLSVVSNRNRG